MDEIVDFRKSSENPVAAMLLIGRRHKISVVKGKHEGSNAIRNDIQRQVRDEGISTADGYP